MRVYAQMLSAPMKEPTQGGGWGFEKKKRQMQRENPVREKHGIPNKPFLSSFDSWVYKKKPNFRSSTTGPISIFF